MENSEYRPLFETELDKKKEMGFLEKLQKHLNCGFCKLPIYYGLDYACVNGETICGWLEIKCRNNCMDAYPTYMISLHKWMKGIELNAKTNKPFLIAVRFLDKDAIFKYNNQEVSIVYRGRTISPRDWQDREPVAMIPMHFFKEIL